MSPVIWVFRAIIIALVGVFLYLYVDYELVFSVYGFFSVVLYFFLSFVSGARYKNMVYYFSGRHVGVLDMFRIPAAMNLASYLFPIKGGGVWLFFYFKTRYGFSSKRSFLLSLFNLLFLFYLMILFLFVVFLNFELNVNLIFFWLFGYFLLLGFVKIVSSSFLSQTIPWGFILIDFFLVVIHFFVLSLLCYFIVGPISFKLSLFLALFLLVSASIKITPGNIGVLEVGAIIVAQSVPDYGDTCLVLVAFYRSLSILHALVAGAPSMISLSMKQKSTNVVDAS